VSALAQFATAIAVIFAVNLLPAFGPPTWSLLVLFSLNFELPAAPLVLGGALAAASGRLVLATATRRLRPRFSPARLARLDRTQAMLTGNRRRTVAGLGLFALSPVPSGQLFVAAGLMTVRLPPLTAAFFAGRLVSYSIYVSVASIAERNLGSVALDALTSPLGMALQIAMVIGLAVLLGGVRPRATAPPRRPAGREPAAPDSRR
jgi:membrane protein YqaA with SNARE-associated domain